VLLEREDELAVLSDALAGARDGRGAIVVVDGPAGIGKTQLLRASTDEAAATQMRVLRASGAALERELPYGCAVALLAEALGELDPADQMAIPGAARALLTGGEPPAGLDPTLPLLHGLHALCVRLTATQPLLLALDDAHDADAASLRLLAYLAARLEELPAALVVAARTGAQPTDAAALDALRAADRRLAPQALSQRAVAECVRARRPEATDAFCAGCADVTAGNPLYLSALLDALDADAIAADDVSAQRLSRLGVESVARAVLGRIAALGPEAMALAGAVAVLGEGAPLRQAAALAGLDPDAAPAAADRLAAADVFRPGAAPAFSHPIVREAVYDDLGAARRAHDHLRAARLVAATPDVAAAHLLRAETCGEAWAVDVLREAAAEARARGVPDRAVALLERALQERPSRPVRAVLLRELGAAQALVFEPDAVATLHEAWDLEPDPAQRSRVALELGRALIMQGRLAECVEVCDRAAGEPGGDPVLVERLQTELISAARLDLSTRPLSLERIAVAPADPQDPLWLANLAYERTLAGEPHLASAGLARRAYAGGALLAAETSDSPTLYLATNTLTLCEQFSEVDGVFADIITEAHGRGSALGYAIASCFRADAANRRGDPRAGRAHAEAAVAASEAHGWALGLPMAIGVLVDALLEMGEPDAAQAALEQAPLTAGPQLPDNVFFIPVLFSRGRLRIAQGGVDEGLADVLEAGRRQDAWGAPNPSVLPWRSTAAEALLALGERDQAAELAATELALAERFGAPRTLTVARRAVALAAAGDDERIERLRAAIAAVAAPDAPVERARCQVDLGAALRRAGHRRDAREPLRAALDAASAAGALALAARAEAELQATGARPRRVRLSGADALTPSERRVAELAAAGRSNPEIAQLLFVTRRTVETHLTSAYRKLDVSSREQLAFVLQN